MISEKAIIALARIAAGAGIFITSMMTAVNGQAQMLAMFLMGVPIEVFQKDKEEA